MEHSSCWRPDGTDYICDLPELPKAIVIAYYHGNYYKISIRSWFPFQDAQYDKRYSNPQEAIRDAEKVILKFISSFLGATDNTEEIKKR